MNNSWANRVGGEWGGGGGRWILAARVEEKEIVGRGGRNATGSGDRFRERRRGFSARSGARTWTRGMVVHGEWIGVFSFSFFWGKMGGVGSKGLSFFFFLPFPFSFLFLPFVLLGFASRNFAGFFEVDFFKIRRVSGEERGNFSIPFVILFLLNLEE